MTTAQITPKRKMTLSRTQMLFYLSDATYPAIAGGYGSGKTEVSNLRLWRLIVANPGCSFASYYPSYDLVRRIAYPRWQTFLTELGIPYELNKKDQTITLPNNTEIIFRSMDEPDKIVGYEVCHSQIDELDTLKANKAEDVWDKAIARNRQKTKDGGKNTISVVSTPEGFRFLYKKWYKDPMQGAELFRMPTEENARNLPPEYIDNLKSRYVDVKLAAYLRAEFVNMASHNVYPNYNRKDNNTPLTMDADDALHIGVDFNVGNMCAVAHIERMVEDGEGDDAVEELYALAVDEITEQMDTPALIAKIKEKWGAERTMYVYPDASGKAKAANNAAQTSLVLLRKAGFIVRAKNKNPLVVDRVATFNRALFKNDQKLHKRIYRVNELKCPHLAESLETQAYTEKGDPDKTSGHDHILDAAGYYTYYRFPMGGFGMTVHSLGDD